MKKFRIVQTGEGFIIQRKGLFMWHNYEEVCIDFMSRYGRWEVSDYLSGVIKYETLDDAKYNLSVIKAFPIKYKKHKIDIAKKSLDNVVVYVDIDSACGDDFYRLASLSLEELKEKIDKYEEDKFQRKLQLQKEKENKKIVKVYEV
jgi:hypothetical protein